MASELGWISQVLDPDILTIGFARRVPSYKRLTLMLQDRERFTELLLDKDRPVQFVIAGKAHPADDGGKRLIQEVVRFADAANVRHRVVFLPDYDMALARVLCAGADVWLNNPLRPLEACGTSGMKAALNGVLNLSIRDGWWDEWSDGNNGWDIPSADEFSEERRDELEAARSTTSSRPRWCRASMTGPQRAAEPVARDGAAHAVVAGAEGGRHPDVA